MQKSEKMLNLISDGRWHNFDQIMEECQWNNRNAIDSLLLKLANVGYVFERRNYWGIRTEVRLVTTASEKKHDGRADFCRAIEICAGKGCYRSENCEANMNFKLSRFAHTLGLKNANQNRKQRDCNL